MTLEGKAQDTCLLRYAPNGAARFGAFPAEARALDARETAHDPGPGADVAV